LHCGQRARSARRLGRILLLLVAELCQIQAMLLLVCAAIVALALQQFEELNH
jgi:hypothetical protein